MNPKRVFGIGISSLTAVLLISCTTEPITGRRQLNLVGEGQEMQLGISEFEKLKQSTPISRDPTVNEMVKRVGNKIAASAANDLPNAEWEFVVFESKEANAYCLPGGKVGVFTGILPITQNEAGLATVLGHEVAHPAAHHGAERMSHALAAQAGGQISGIALSSASPMWQSSAALAYPTLAQVGVLLPYSRKQESTADRIGLSYMARAGYDPAEAVKFWQRFAEYNQSRGGKGTPSFLSTHPLDEARIKQIQSWLPEVQNEYKTSPVTAPAKR